MQVSTNNEDMALNIRNRIEEIVLERRLKYGDSELHHLWQAIQECAGQLSDCQTHLSLYPAKAVRDYLDFSKFCGSLLVRQCYKDTRDIIEAARTEDNFGEFLVLGSPGIGKSYFLLYMLIFLTSRREKQTVIYFNSVYGNRYMLCVGTDIAVEIPTFDAYKKLLRTWDDDRINYYQLYDAGTKGFKTDPIVSNSHVVTIVASSPDKSNYMQFAKEMPEKFYMEPWNYKELKEGNQLLNHPIEESKLRKRYALAGGIPRWVLNPSFDLEVEVCFAVRDAAGEDIRKAWKDANSGMSTATDSGISHKICQIVPTKDRRKYSSIPAGMFAAYHIQAMTEMSDDENFRVLFETLGMIKTAGPFAGHTFEAYVHLMVERGTSESIDFRFFPPHPNLPRSLSLWNDKRLEEQRFRSFHSIDELNGAAKMAANSYWKARAHNFPSIDGFAIRESEEGLCVHFIQITMSRRGKKEKVSEEDLHEYVHRIMEGWKGNKAKVFVLLWFVLSANLYESETGPYHKEQALKMGTDMQRSKDGYRVAQGAVKFDWNRVKRTPIKDMVDSWWSTNEAEFCNRCKEFEETFLASRMRLE